MNFLDRIQNIFKPHEPKTIIVTGAKPGDTIPVESLEDEIVFLPCPLHIRMTRACICLTCGFVTKNCPMEKLCRGTGCEESFIKGCTNYTNKEDTDGEEKRRVFKDGSHFYGGIFRFGSKFKGDSTIGG